jgi:hypothetical protein
MPDLKYKLDRVAFDGAYMTFRANEKRYRVRTEQVSVRLAKADAPTQQKIAISPGGFTISWPGLNLEMSINCLMQMAMPWW